MIRTAKIINTRGLKGECKLYSYTDDPAHRFKPGRVLYLDEGKKHSLKVLRYSESKGFIYVFFQDVDSIEKAELLKGKSLYIPVEDLPEPEEDEFYYHELMDCEVFNEEKEYLGKVVDILETGPSLVLRVQSESENFLLPFVNQFVVEVDRQEKKMIIREMAGLRS